MSALGKFAPVLVSLLATAALGEAQEVKMIRAGGIIQVAATDIIELVGYGAGYGYLESNFGDRIDIGYQIFSTQGGVAMAEKKGLIITGITALTARQNWATVRITKPASQISPQPSNAVVIPEDANGSYQVILESSVDMVIWTAANPGTYGGNTPKRFFRTRIVKQS